MSRVGSVLPFVLLMGVSVGFSGCESDSTTPPSTSRDANNDHDHSSHDHSSHEHGDASENAAQLAKLSSEDRAAAEKQKVCPVTDEPLGSMGVPPKVLVDGREVFICCKGCEDALKKDPEKYLEKLPN